MSIIDWLINRLHRREWPALHYLCSCMNKSCVCVGTDTICVFRYAGPEIQLSSGGFCRNRALETKASCWVYCSCFSPWPAAVHIRHLIIKSSRKKGLGTTEHGSSRRMRLWLGKYRCGEGKFRWKWRNMWSVRWVQLKSKLMWWQKQTVSDFYSASVVHVA